MNLKQLIDKNLQQWPVKVICLIIAIFIYIFHQVSLIDKKTFVVPLTIQENGNVMHVGNTPNSVAVIVRTSNENMKVISNNDITAVVNLDTIVEKGVYELPVRVVISDEIKALDPLEIRLKDNKIVVEVDNKAFKYVKVEPSIVGEVQHNYEIESISVIPSTVKISGPQSLIDVTDEVFTSRVNVSNAETSFSTETSIQLVTKLISYDDEGDIKIDVKVVPRNMELEVDVPVELMNLSSDLVCTDEVPTVRIKLFGTVSYLENYHVPRRSIQAYLGDIKEPGTYELPLYFYFPRVIDIIEKSSETITVNVVPKTEASAEAEESSKSE